MVAIAVNAVNAVNQIEPRWRLSFELEFLMPLRPSQPSSDIREIISVDKARQRLRGLLLEGASSDRTAPVGASYFDSLRDRALKASK
ncbi:type II toxin-antitoxin system ParD family antitoxin [Rhizobium leguminosarum]|uniref:type II toxin-antitoxin system ParD family antitoxin n=1 Tax=Rhizobium leguminosarum TaxID=384 RepID=UPI00102FD378|nr:type II toxin-antitoxin system ParD family antitoxin [Rhizobium leguminosarum]TAV76211.1 type II toxin-antitoxin system ParD family antitoxin [Rhizobium leguminosarum]TAV80810.1 type II toxin-antitoxin system ParD family antitoxin [Rhizobium leguminosarum]TAZ32536.1 type II toxin-antitoxin system ParD family antitoxin [Rhizobium leguminosarum]